MSVSMIHVTPIGLQCRDGLGMSSGGGYGEWSADESNVGAVYKNRFDFDEVLKERFRLLGLERDLMRISINSNVGQ